MPTKRLEAEVIRDSILAMSGRLDSVMGGPPIRLTRPARWPSRRRRIKTPAPGRRQQTQCLPALPPGLQPLAAHGFRPPAVCRQLPQARHVGDPAAIADDAQRPDSWPKKSAHFAARVAALAPQTIDGTVEEAFTVALCRLPDNRELARCTSTSGSKAKSSKNPAKTRTTPPNTHSPSFATLCLTPANFCTQNETRFKI